MSGNPDENDWRASPGGVLPEDKIERGPEPCPDDADLRSPAGDPHENDWRASPGEILGEDKIERSPMDGPEQADPRSPVRKLLDLFALPDEREEAFTKALLAASDVAGKDPELGEQRRADAMTDYSSGSVPSTPPDAVTTGASGADVQLSMPKVLFPWWHINPMVFPAEFDNPVRIKLSDTVASTMPEPGTVPEDEDEDDAWWVPDGDDHTIFAKLQRMFLKMRELGSKAEHAQAILDGVEERISKIKTARALMPFIPEGKKAGQLQKVSYTTVIGGGDSADVGWMFVEPSDSEYGKWFAEQLKKRYDDFHAAWEKLPDTDPGKKDAWGQACVAASTIVIANQEAAPSGINTYDSRVLSWGIGLAAPGLLQKVMYLIVKDPKVWKVFYCCGFMYDANIRTVKGGRDEYHGVYQIVDVERKAVVYADNFYHRTVPQKKQKKGEFEGKSFLALRAFVTQRELLHMLVQVARDPETRDTVMNCNYDFIKGAANVKSFKHIHTQALYVFLAQIQHNWGIGGHDFIKEGLATEPGDWMNKPNSEQKDRAIARGAVRVLAREIQEQRFQNAVKALRTGKYPKELKRDSFIWMFPATTEFGPKRLLENYWSKMERGERTQDKSKLEVPGFMVPVTSAPQGNYLWRERDDTLAFDLGPAAKMDLRFLDDEVAVREIVDDNHVKVGRKNAKKEWELESVDATRRR